MAAKQMFDCCETIISTDEAGESIKILDTTLRDGQQCPGAGMTPSENLEYARIACRLNVDVLEAGFPSASAADFSIVRQICEVVAENSSHMRVAALCQLREDQVIKTISSLESLAAVKRARLHTYVPVDPRLMPASLGNRSADGNAIISDVFRLIKMSHDAGLEVQFSPEGYSRMADNFDFVTELIMAAVEAGATIINCPDTIGGACALEGENYFVAKMNQHAALLKTAYPDRHVTWSVHCHNDFGLAVQNTINAVFLGPARQIEGCINGVGERAGNASLEQCVMLIKQFGAGRFLTKVDTRMLQVASDFVAKHMLPRQPHWPVTGENASRHSSGGHTNAILKNPLAYQPFDPNEVGKNITFLFGPLSGGNHAKAIIEDNGFICSDGEKAAIAQFVKDTYAERRKGITDNELMRAYFQFRQPIKIESIDYSRQGEVVSVCLNAVWSGKAVSKQEEIRGKDSALAAAKKLFEQEFGPFELLSHRSSSESTGIGSRSISRISIEMNGLTHEGTGIDQDIEISAIKAMIDAVNVAYIKKHYARPTNVNRACSTAGGAGAGLCRVS